MNIRRPNQRSNDVDLQTSITLNIINRLLYAEDVDWPTSPTKTTTNNVPPYSGNWPMEILKIDWHIVYPFRTERRRHLNVFTGLLLARVCCHTLVFWVSGTNQNKGKLGQWKELYSVSVLRAWRVLIGDGPHCRTQDPGGVAGSRSNSSHLTST